MKVLDGSVVATFQPEFLAVVKGQVIGWVKVEVLDSTVGMKTVEMNVVVVNVVGIPPLVPPTHQHSGHSSCKQTLLPAASHDQKVKTLYLFATSGNIMLHILANNNGCD